MTVGVVGLGLIGGSFAKAFKYAGLTPAGAVSRYASAEDVYVDRKSAPSGTCVLGADRDEATAQLARLTGAIDDLLTEENLGSCDYIILALYPGAAVEWLTQHAASIGKKTIVIDTCGIKQRVCEACFALAAEHGFTFIGGHPMAGVHEWGFKYASEHMFEGASMILVPESTGDVQLLSAVSEQMKAIGFGSVTITSAQEHDKNIAFTSQLAHVVSNAYVKSPGAIVHKGFSAGSYRDMTRVAKLNEVMWTELFLDNREYLKAELDGLIERLQDYSRALEEGDAPRLQQLLRDGRQRKESIDFS